MAAASMNETSRMSSNRGLRTSATCSSSEVVVMSSSPASVNRPGGALVDREELQRPIHRSLPMTDGLATSRPPRRPIRMGTCRRP